MLALLRRLICRHQYETHSFGLHEVKFVWSVLYRYPAEWFVCNRCGKQRARLTRRATVWSIGADPNDPFWRGDYDLPGSLGPGDPGKLTAAPDMTGF